MKLSYAIENLRRIQFTPDIEMRPITILVGRNSAGKSTFLRSFPLIRQSLETPSSAPILWFGNLVDFGDITTSIPETDGTRQAAFRFNIKNLRGYDRPRYSHFPSFYWTQETIHIDRLSLRYVIGSQDNKTVLQAIEITIPGEHIDVRINLLPRPGGVGEIFINGTLAHFITDHYDVSSTNRSLFSPPELTSRSEETDVKSSRPQTARDIIALELISLFRHHVTRKLSRRTIWHEAQKVLSLGSLNEVTIKELMNSTPTVTFQTLYTTLLHTTQSPLTQQAFALHALARVFVVLDLLDDRLTEFFLNVRYLGPVRAASERFYRRQELARPIRGEPCT